MGGPVSSRDLLLTGHEDGSVCVWAAGDVSLKPIYRSVSRQPPVSLPEEHPQGSLPSVSLRNIYRAVSGGVCLGPLKVSLLSVLQRPVYRVFHAK